MKIRRWAMKIPQLAETTGRLFCSIASGFDLNDVGNERFSAMGRAEALITNKRFTEADHAHCTTAIVCGVILSTDKRFA
jgi:hypothetical protein